MIRIPQLADQVADKENYLRSVLDAIPMPVMVMDEEARILDHNRAAEKIVGIDRDTVLYQPAGEVMHCLNSAYPAAGCGQSEQCRDCVVRNSIAAVMKGERIHRSQARLVVVTADGNREVQMLVTASPVEIEGRRRALVILEDITELITLRGLLPICAQCKSIRTDDSYWQRLETFFTSHLGVNFTHGLCPECAKKLYSDYLR
jgi:PAS domain-containing protein